MCFLLKEKCTLRTMRLFFQKWVPSFVQCFLQFAACFALCLSAVCDVCLLEKAAFCGNASVLLADRSLTHFLEHCLSTFCDTRGSKMPATSERALSWAHKEKSKWERFRCTRCKRATARNPRAIKTCVQAQWFLRNWAQYARPSPCSTKCIVRAISRALMMPETITPRVVAVCDAATNRSGVSSSSSASKCCATANSLGVTHWKRHELQQRHWKTNRNGLIRRTLHAWWEQWNSRHGRWTRLSLWARCVMANARWLGFSRSWKKRTRPTRRRRGAAPLEQLASTCHGIVSKGRPTTKNLENLRTSMQFVDETACNQHHGTHTNKGHRDINEQAPKRGRDNSLSQTEKLRLQCVKNGMRRIMAPKLREMCVLQEKSSLRQGAPTSMCTTQGGAACSAPYKKCKEEGHKSPTCYLLRWPVIRLY